MPIVVDHTPGGVAAGLALAAGTAQGNAQRMQQQRGIDAQLLSQLNAQKQQLKVLGMTQGLARDQMSQQDRARQDNVRVALERLKVDQQQAEQQNRLDQQRADNQTLEARSRAAERGAKQRDAEAQRAAAQGLAQQIDEVYAGRPKDILYSQAMAQAQKNGTLSEQTASALGITTEAQRRARENAQISAAPDAQFEPKSTGERRARRLLDLGNFDQVGQRLRQIGPLFGPEAPGYNDAMDALVQTQAWAQTVEDPAEVDHAISALQQQGVGQDVLQPLQERADELRQQVYRIKAPAAFETAMSSFEAQASLLSQNLGRPLSPSESSRLLGEQIGVQLQASGIPLDQFEAWVDSQDDIRTAATKQVEQAMAQQQGTRPMGDTDQTGSEDRMGSDAEQPMPTVDDYPGVVIQHGRATFPEYLVPINPDSPAGGFVDTRTGKQVDFRRVLAPYLDQLYQQQGQKLDERGLPIKGSK